MMRRETKTEERTKAPAGNGGGFQVGNTVEQPLSGLLELARRDTARLETTAEVMGTMVQVLKSLLDEYEQAGCGVRGCTQCPPLARGLGGRP